MNSLKITKLTLIFILATIICLPTLFPLFKPNLFHLHDYTHVARLYEMDQAIKDGHFPVRWSKNLGFGYGLPQFNFYAPLPYYFAEIFHLIGFSYIFSFKLLIVTIFLFSFLAMYFAASKLWGAWGGWLSATAFIYAPYRAVDFYVRGAVGELSGILFISLSLFFLVSWLKNPQFKTSIAIGISLSGIILSHNLTGLISVPLLGLIMFAITIFHTQQPKSTKNLVLQLISAGIITFSLSAFYSLPAFFEKQHTLAANLTTGFSHYSHHFVYLRQLIHSPWGYGGSIWGLMDDVSFEIGKIHIILGIVAGLLIFFKPKNLNRQQKLLLIISGMVILLSIFMLSFKSQFIWDLIPLLSYVQFPWRFLSLILVFSSFMLGAATHWFPQTMPKMVFVLIASSAIILFELNKFKPESYLDHSQSLYYTDPHLIQTQMSGVIPDFMPLHQQELPLEVPGSRFIVSPPTDSLSVNVDRVHQFSLSLQPDQPTNIRINIAHFPGWTLYLNGQAIPFNIDPQTGAMNLTLLPSTHQTQYLSGIFTETPLRKTANTITIICLISLFTYLFYCQLFKKNINSHD